MTFLFDDNCVKHMGRTTYYQDTRAEDTADIAGSGAIDDEDIPIIIVIVGWLSTEYIPSAVMNCMCQGIWAHTVAT